MNLRFEPEPWMRDRACNHHDGDIWFPERENGSVAWMAREAKQICRTECPVAKQCLRYALDNDERWGIWGGLDHKERRKFLKRLNRPEGDAA